MWNNVSNKFPCYAAQNFFKARCHTKYLQYTSDIPNIWLKLTRSEKQIKEKKKADFITTEIDLIGEK